MRTAFALFFALALANPTGRATATTANAGESIYLYGISGSGAPIEAARPASGLSAKGADAACVNCHQRSGLGSYEGYNEALTIPPITGPYLFHARAAVTNQPILPYVEWMHGNRDPYTDQTLARAIRDGLDSQGRPLHHLMPRYPLSDADMASLISYLKNLGQSTVPGVGDSVLHFATVITPDADPVRRRAMLGVMEAYFAEKNNFPIGPSRQLRTSGKTGYAKSMFMSHRLWQLHVWDLSGPRDTWQAQLERHFSEQPVLAMVSGLGAGNWTPVHEFCQKQAVPCLFPNVDVPVDDRHDFYSIYFSRGVLLEAELIARAIADMAPGARPVQVQQVYRAGDSGEAAARELAATLEHAGIEVHDLVLESGATLRGMEKAFPRAGGSGALVLWLRPKDLAALGEPPGAAIPVFISGLMGGLEQAPLPLAWRSRARLAYPYEMPEQRSLRMRYPLTWFSMNKIPVVDEPLQTNTFLACGLLAETLSHVADNFAQPYLVEMLQASIERRLINTGYYPRLVLGWNQHFASKGGYMARFVDPAGSRVAAESDWLVP